MITRLAKSRIRYHKNRTILTGIAIMLTTMLLMAIVTSANGLLEFNRQMAASVSNAHATIKNLTSDQVKKLQNHLEVEALETQEIIATVEYEKMNGFLSYRRTLKEGITYGVGTLIEGKEPEKSNEICGARAFFERMGVEPVVGNHLEISFRPQGKGKIQTREFVISGLVSERDLSKLDVSDSRIAYSATVSEALVEELIAPQDRDYNATIRAVGEQQCNYDQLTEKIEGIAVDIGTSTENVSIRKEYVFTATDPGMDTIQIAGALALLILLFSGMIIYSIYYVGVITDIQEIGKLKALGASRKQIRRLLQKEGLYVTAAAMPAGLLLGYLIPVLVLPAVMKRGVELNMGSFELKKIPMFTLPGTILAVLGILFMVAVSLLKPAHMAAKISPVEAIRYQESSRGRKLRRGYSSVSVFRLSKANMFRNKRRTMVTMITMGMSCVLFMSLAGVLNSMRAEDIADRQLDGSDFRISLDYALNDEEYPENNLENIMMDNPFTDALQQQIAGMDGVKEVRCVRSIAAGSDARLGLFAEERHITVSPVTRERVEEYKKELKRGELDYDRLVRENGAILTWDTFWEDYGLELDEEIPLTIYDGDRQISFTIRVEASGDWATDSMILIPQEVYDSIGITNNAVTDLHIRTEKGAYEKTKAALEEIVDANERFRLYSRDEEMVIGAMAVDMTKYPMYAILLMIAVIGFMNLINTMITSIITRKQELGMLQAAGLSNRQLVKMLAGEGMVYTAGTLMIAVTLGNLFGYLLFLWGKESHFMSVTVYHFPLWETLALAVLLGGGQLGISCFVRRLVGKDSLIDRIRSGE